MTAISPDQSRTATQLLTTMRASLSIESHLNLLLWLQGDVRRLIPHEALISFSLVADRAFVDYDVASLQPGLRTAELPARGMHDIGATLHQRWTAMGGTVVAESTAEFLAAVRSAPPSLCALSEMPHALFHGIADNRLRADHLYVLLRSSACFGDDEKRVFELLLPYLDAALSKIERLPAQAAPLSLPISESITAPGLSLREREILEWVRQGKTNIEIGMILGISSFTVKNHLKRIFQKINVSNRAQAVGKLESIVRLDSRGLAYT